MAGGARGKSKKSSIALRLALLVLLPFLLGCFVFPHEYYAEGMAISSPISGTREYVFSASSHQALMEKSMGSVFPLYKYVDYIPFVTRDVVEICAANESGLILQDGTRLEPEREWGLGDSEGQGGDSGAFCADIPPSPHGAAAPEIPNASTNASGSSIILSSASKAHPRFEVEYGVLQGLVMIPVFYLLIYYPATEIWKKLHHGMHA